MILVRLTHGLANFWLAEIFEAKVEDEESLLIP